MAVRLLSFVLVAKAYGLTPAGRLPQAIETRRDFLVGSSCLAVLAGQPAEAQGEKSRDDQSYTVRKTDDEWRRELSRQEYFVLRNGGTERPFTSPLNSEKHEGIFLCVGCGTPLFSSADKFNSGTGWPSFAAGLEGVEVQKTALEGFTGAELRCKTCGGHLGDRFTDGKVFTGTRAAETGYRYCIDGTSLVFVPKEAGLLPVRGDPSYSASNSANSLPKFLLPPPIKVATS